MPLVKASRGGEQLNGRALDSYKVSVFISNKTRAKYTDQKQRSKIILFVDFSIYLRNLRESKIFFEIKHVASYFIIK